MNNSVDMLRSLILGTNGKFAKIIFKKKSGEIREMVFRTGVRKGLVGGTNKVSHINKYITVYDVVNKGYRHVNLETVQSIKCGKVLFDESLN